MRDRAVYDLAKVEVKYISTKSCSFSNFGKTNPIFSHLSNDLRFSNPRAEVTAEGTCARWTVRALPGSGLSARLFQPHCALHHSAFAHARKIMAVEDAFASH